MAKPAAPTNDLLTTGLSERSIPLEVRPIFDLNTSTRSCAVARLGGLNGHRGRDIERFAELQGRRRELLIYMLERAARHIRSWRARGFHGTLFVPLPPQVLEDRTLATSLDIIAKSQSIDQGAFTVLVPQTDYFKRGSDVLNAMWRVRKAGCGVAMLVDARAVIKFAPLADHPFTAFVFGGKNVWRRLKTTGPGKLGATGSWIGWAESLGLQRVAAGVTNEDERATARLYGFGHGEGSHFAEFGPAKSFIGDDEGLAVNTQNGLPPRPVVISLRRA